MDTRESTETQKDQSAPGGTNLLDELLEQSPRSDILDVQLIVLTILAGIVAMFGLFLNNVAVIIGAMVISPLLDPIYAGTVFLANGAFKKFLNHVKVVMVLVLVLIIVTAGMTWTLSQVVSLPITPEISSRLIQQEISAILAIFLGITAIFAHKRGFVSSVIGIGIAIALVPPAVVTGITIILLPARTFDALALTLNNVFGLYAGMLIAILALGAGPKSEVRKKLTRKNVIFMLASVGVLLILIGYSLYLRHTLPS